MGKRVFIVTGANKGIGFEIVKKLCTELKNEDAAVVLTSRCLDRGKQAISKLAAEGLTAELEQLDVSDEKSVADFAERIKTKYGEVECLVNNAGFYEPSSTVPMAEKAKKTLSINYYGLRDVTKAIFPLLKQNAHLVNVASLAGEIAIKTMSAEIRHRLMRKSATVEDLDAVAAEYMKACEEGKREGWPNRDSAEYDMSKALVIALTAYWARVFDKEGKGMIATCCCPGWCKSDLAGWEQPPLTASDGADVIVPLALRPSKDQHGKFVKKEETQDFRED